MSHLRERLLERAKAEPDEDTWLLLREAEWEIRRLRRTIRRKNEDMHRWGVKP